MNETGMGLTFTRDDVTKAKRVQNILQSFDYKLEGATMVIEAAQALAWYATLLPKIEANIFVLKHEEKVLTAPKTRPRGKSKKEESK